MNFSFFSALVSAKSRQVALHFPFCNPKLSAHGSRTVTRSEAIGLSIGLVISISRGVFKGGGHGAMARPLGCQ